MFPTKKVPKGKATTEAGGGASATAPEATPTAKSVPKVIPQVPMDPTPKVIIAAPGAPGKASAPGAPNWKNSSVFGANAEKTVLATVSTANGRGGHNTSILIQGSKFICMTKLARSSGWILVVRDKSQMEIPREYERLVNTKYTPGQYDNIPDDKYINSFYFDGYDKKKCGGVKNSVATLIINAINNKTEISADEGEVPQIILDYTKNTIKFGNNQEEGYMQDNRRQEPRATQSAPQDTHDAGLRREIDMLSAAAHATSKDVSRIGESLDSIHERFSRLESLLAAIATQSMTKTADGQALDSIHERLGRLEKLFETLLTAIVAQSMTKTVDE